MAVSENAKRLKQLRERAGLSTRDLAKLLKWSGHTRVQYYEDVYKGQHLPQRIVKELAPHLIGNGEPPITEGEVLGLAGMSPSAPAAGFTLEVVSPSSHPSPAPRPGLAAGVLPPAPPPLLRPDDRERANPLPVFASTEGDEPDTMLITPRNPIDKIPRPRQVQVRDAFAVYLVGESMSPVYDENDELYIHPHLRPQPEDDCLFVHQREDGSLLVQVKRLVKARPDKWRVHQFNPDKDFDLDRRKWAKAWVIVGKMNRAS